VDQIFNLTDVVVNTGGTLDLNGRLEAIDALTGAGTITNTSGTDARLYVGYGNTAANFAGVIENGIGGAKVELNKIGTGPLILGGTKYVYGPTTVSAGVLQVDGQLANTTVSLNAGTLQGEESSPVR
jgi:autotransporter-associated beta strand protein